MPAYSGTVVVAGSGTTGPIAAGSGVTTSGYTPAGTTGPAVGAAPVVTTTTPEFVATRRLGFGLFGRRRYVEPMTAPAPIGGPIQTIQPTPVPTTAPPAPLPKKEKDETTPKTIGSTTPMTTTPSVGIAPTTQPVTTTYTPTYTPTRSRLFGGRLFVRGRLAGRFSM